MPRLHVTTRAGDHAEIESRVGASVMEAIAEARGESDFGICGGCMSCGSCHVHLGHEWVGMFPPPSSEEEAILDFSDFRDDSSRLSCQLRLKEEHEGLTLVIAPLD